MALPERGREAESSEIVEKVLYQTALLMGNTDAIFNDAEVGASSLLRRLAANAFFACRNGRAKGV